LPRRLVLLAAVLAAGCGSSPHADRPTTSPRRAPDAGSAPIAGQHRRPAAHVPIGPRDAPVTILMYHVVAPAPAGTRYPELWVSADRFRAQMRALAHAGYHATTLGRVWLAWHRHATMPRHPIVVSFDDGYLSQYTNARPVLDALRWPGVLNLEVGNVGPDGMPRHLVRALVRDGWEVDAHTLTHPDLTTVDAARLHEEIAGSRAWIQHAFGVPVDFFCYPAGRYDATVEQAVHAAGFLAATTTQPGRARPSQDPYALPRLRVTPDLTPDALVAQVRTLS
jgi:peptidoglycan/xylan/chitin deacetylase (PgdA/CDA1 family)